MKLVLCKKCWDVIKLEKTVRTCKCGSAGGKYLNDIQAVYYGSEAIPLGFNNSSLLKALQDQPEYGAGWPFDAFVIPKECPTMEKISVPDNSFSAEDWVERFRTIKTNVQ